MATTDLALHEASGHVELKRIVNDMSIQVGTVNGSGSQSSNTVLLRTIFQMGVPVSGKNLFPSNIAGLPTWYTIRANKDGYIARKKEIDFCVAMNPETAQQDVMSLGPGAAVLYDEPLNLSSLRNDLVFQQFSAGSLDLVFIDHAKEEYVPDLQRIVARGWLHQGSVVVADNIKLPGAPAYRKHMQAAEGKEWRSIEHSTHAEYQTLLKDIVLESDYIGAQVAARI